MLNIRLILLHSAKSVISLLQHAQTKLRLFSNEDPTASLISKFTTFHSDMLSDLSNSVADRCIQTAKQYLVRSHIYLSQEQEPAVEVGSGKILPNNDLIDTLHFITLLFDGLQSFNSKDEDEDEDEDEDKDKDKENVNNDNDQVTETIGANLLDVVSKHLTKAIITAPNISKHGIDQFRRDKNLLLDTFPKSEVLIPATCDKVRRKRKKRKKKSL